MLVSEMINWLKTQRQDAIVRVQEIHIPCDYCEDPNRIDIQLLPFRKELAYLVLKDDCDRDVCFLDIISAL